MDYLGLNEVNTHISFGTTADRPTFPDQIAHDRFGNENNPLRGVKDVGPAQYDYNEKTSFTYLNKPLSLKGYVIGARTQQRSFSPHLTDAPAPTHYQASNTQEKEIKQAQKPFHSSAHRFSNKQHNLTPGPGTYESDVERNRNVQMLHTFGGRVSMVPAVDIKCVIQNTDHCENCLEKVANKGDYYEFKRHVLCASCYDYNLKFQEKYNRSFLASFKKIRHCEFMHDHQGTNAAIQKLSDKELRKLKRKEAYLRLYYA